MYLDYLQERYTEGDFNIPKVAEDFEDLQKQTGNSVTKLPEGFITWRLVGDAVIIDDIYVKPEHRQNRKISWKLHDLVLKQAKLANKRVAIGFTELIGKNHIAGLKAMNAAGFIPAFKTNISHVFIKGI